MTPKVTIGFCVRNCETSIEDAIRSALSQDFQHELMELIFVDDGSKDNTLSIIRKLVSETSLPTQVFHFEWRGIGHARNIVVANARSQYIVWVDGDMILSSNYVRKLVELMDSNYEIGIAKGVQSTKPLGNNLGILETYARHASRMIDYKSNYNPSKTLGTGGAIYRYETLKIVGPFDEQLRGYGEDWDFELRARKAGWSLCTVNVAFIDYERNGIAWSSLWRRYWLRGYHSHHFLHKHRGVIKHARMNPLSSFLAGFLQSRVMFQKTRQKIVFLLPFEYLFKTVAWYVGFLNSHLCSYEYQFSV